MSYNFEANYNHPSLAEDFIPGPLSKVRNWINSFFRRTTIFFLNFELFEILVWCRRREVKKVTSQKTRCNNSRKYLQNFRKQIESVSCFHFFGKLLLSRFHQYYLESVRLLHIIMSRFYNLILVFSFFIELATMDIIAFWKPFVKHQKLHSGYLTAF